MSPNPFVFRVSPFPLKVKPVWKIDLQKLREMECAHEECFDFFEYASRWLDNPAAYSECEKSEKLGRTALTGDQIRQMTDVKVGPYKGKVLSTLRGFTVDEVAKKVARPILNPNVNKNILKRHLQSFRQAPKEYLRNQGLAAKFCYQLDMSSCYDQFGLDEKVRGWFCFRTPDGQVFAQTSLGMGFRPSCEIAQGALWKLLDFPMKCLVATCIDNIRFIGEGAFESMKIFLRRCQEVGVQFNGVNLYDENRNPVSLDFLDEEKMKEYEGDFLGERYNYVRKTRSNTEKTIKKLESVWAQRANWTARQFAVFIGIATYASSVADVKCTQFYGALRSYARLSQITQSVPYLWDFALDSVFPLPRSVLFELGSWFTLLQQNKPVALSTVLDPVELVLIVDSSHKGWGCVSLNPGSGSVHHHQDVWPPENRARFSESVASEPEGIWRAICRFVPHTCKSVHIFTDHLSLVYAAKSGRPHCHHYNTLLERLRVNFPRTRFIFTHTAGDDMLADGISRGLQWTDDDQEKAIAIARDYAHQDEKVQDKMRFHEWMK
jgi:hypothetical protein